MSVERRVRKNGKSCWYARWRDPDGRARGRIFDTRQQALAWDAETRRRRRLGELGMYEDSKRTLSELHGHWWPMHSESLSSSTRWSYDYAWTRYIESRLGRARLNSITPLAIEKFVHGLLEDGVGYASCEKCWVVLSLMLGRATSWGWIAKNPVRDARKPKNGRQKRAPRALMPAEVEALRAAMPTQMDRALTSTLAYSGCRPGEALGLRWDDIGERAISVSRSVSDGELKSTKTRRSRTVPMIPALAFELAAWRISCPSEEIVFPDPDGGHWDEGRYRRWRKRTFKKALAETGLDGAIRVYDLRSTRASMLIRSGVDIVTASRWMGHSPTVLLEAYGALMEGLENTIDVDQEIAAARRSYSGRDGAAPEDEVHPRRLRALVDRVGEGQGEPASAGGG